ncbi:hypothetical protein DEO72_LG2g2544 [Vigna unguiculata]|uniref:Uncharacterized protein n=1 Tax=Vigna unguiculata TaxID=3917 RepID=A0A4D6L149_VIGUN|nr:hypothetical protein DEO72_LG2g2544 [Vigna unguiculata]
MALVLGSWGELVERRGKGVSRWYKDHLCRGSKTGKLPRNLLSPGGTGIAARHLLDSAVLGWLRETVRMWRGA